MISETLDKIFEPDRIAIIGASPKSGSIGNDIWSIYNKFGFKGEIFPVNPSYNEIDGRKSYSNVKDIEGEVDLAIVAIPAEGVPDVVRGCAEKETAGVIVMAGGFSETGNEELERKLLKAVEGSPTRIIGPNCMGIYCSSSRVTYDESFPKESGNVSFITQSGGIGKIFTFLFSERGGRVSKLVSSGNECDLQFMDYMKYFSEDSDTEVIAGYVEQIRGGENFLSQAKKITKRKPTVLWKAGKGEAGKRAAKSHTGALAGSEEVYSGVLSQVGIVQARSLEELIDFTQTFATLEPAKVKSVGIVTGPGGIGVSIADACEDEGLEVPAPSKKLKEDLRDELPPYAQISNPIDLTFAVDKKPSLIEKPLDKMMEQEWVDALAVGGTPHAGIIQKSPEALKKVSESYEKPLALISPKFREAEEDIRELIEAGVPVYSSARGFAKSMRALNRYARYKDRS